MSRGKSRRREPAGAKTEPDGVVEAKIEIHPYVSAESPDTICEKCGRPIYPSQLSMRVRRNGVEGGWVHSSCAIGQG
jgi:hypothetical protein